MNTIKLITIFIISFLLQILVYSQVHQDWVALYNGTGNGSDQANDVAVDNSGNVYVTGQSIGAYVYYDIVTIKYNSSGVQQWVARLNGSGNTVDEGKAITVDSSGNVYVTGFISTAYGTYYEDMITIKYNSAGVQQWAKVYISPENGGDEGVDIKLDDASNVYALGVIYEDMHTNLVMIKYSSSGNQLWAMRYEVAVAITPRDLVLDISGNIYIAGSVMNPYDDFFVLKYNNSGAYQWIQIYDHNGQNDGAESIDVDNAGNVFVTGVGSATSDNVDIVTLKYNSSGVLQWNKSYDGTAHNLDEARSVAVDNAGNCIVTGASEATGTGTDMITIKYNTLGSQLWVQRYNRSSDFDDYGYSIATGAFNNIYVTGYSRNIFNQSDIVTVKYNPAGEEQWVKIYNGTSDSSDLARKVVTKGLGDVYVIGYSKNAGSLTDFTTIKYSQPIGIEPISNEVPNNFSLSQNYPNPFNPTTNIIFSIPQSVILSGAKNLLIELKIYDVLGKEIATLVNENLKAGTYKVDWNASNYPSGVYFYKLIADNFIDTKKMILVK
jgi:uncharacterized delta-60 repeat protein